MYTVKFHLKTITPVFMYGADGETPELRTQSIKGMMRFWWRAIHSDIDIKELKKQEKKIFGGVGTKNSQKSKFTLHILKSEKEYNLFKYSPVPHKHFKKIAIKPGNQFVLSIKSTDDSILEIAKDTFIISTILGGFGQRARRGFGSYKIIRINDKDFSEFERNANILEMHLNQVFHRINSNFQFNTKNEKADFPYLKDVKIGEASRSYDEYLKIIGQASHNHDSDFTGFAKRNEKLASPVYVSLIQNNQGFLPVISILNTAFKNGWNPSGNMQKQSEFVKEVLGEEN